MKIGFCNGCFDGMHDGHKFFLDQCCFKCDLLIVGVNGDAWIKEHKGADRPLHDLRSRVYMLGNFRDAAGHSLEVVPFMAADPDSMLWQIQPGVVFRGWDQAASEYCALTHTPLERIPRLGNFSTTLLAHGT